MKTRFLILFFSVTFFFSTIVECVDEHMWLHVEGKYIRTSLHADAPNEIFVCAGVDRDQDVKGSAADIASWIKNKGCNIVRFSLHTLPWPIGNQRSSTLSQMMQDYVNPFVQACKSDNLYVLIDQHEYFHRYRSGDGWLPTGALWSSSDVQAWISHWVTLASMYKDEPWVAGYELCNEPYNADPAFVRNAYIQCIQAIRQVDNRHMIFLGNDNYSHASTMEEVWGPVNFKPDEPCNQVVYAFHEYTGADNPDKVAPVLDSIQSRYNVPVFCTEFGDAGIISGQTTQMKRQFEIDMFAMFLPRKIGWAIYELNGTYPNIYEPGYSDIWNPAVYNQGSPIPRQGMPPVSKKIYCKVLPDSIPADGISMSTIAAIIQDVNGSRIFEADDSITFSLTGNGALIGSNSVAAKNGIAMIKLRSGNIPGMATVSASAAGLDPGSVDVIFSSAPSKINCSASPDSLPAGCSGFSLLTFTAVDAGNNKVTNVTGTINFSISGPGSLWLTETLTGNSRDLVDGQTTLLLKAGNAAGDAVVRATLGNLIPGEVTVKIEKNNPDNPVYGNIKAYPNPCDFSNGQVVRFKVGAAGSKFEDIKIYTLRGKLVRKLAIENGAIETTWDGRNQDGKMVVKGIYVYKITQTNGNRITGKLAVKQ